jgi:AraC-like DNA-binding protein
MSRCVRPSAGLSITRHATPGNRARYVMNMARLQPTATTARSPRGLDADGSPSVAVFRSALLTLGRVEMRPDHPQFRDGPVPGDMVVFPEHPFRLARSRDVTRTIDSTVAVTYFQDQEFRRCEHTARGTQANWIAPQPALAAELTRLGRGRSHSTDDSSFPATAIPVAVGVHAQVMALLRCAQLRHPDDLTIEERAVELLHRVFSADGARRAANPPTEAQRDLVERTRFELSRDLSSSLSLGPLAASLHTSPAQLCRLFRAATGTTMRVYRRELRINRALAFLRDTSDDLTSIAFASGFASHSHFTLWFRRALGHSPSRERRLLRDEG